MDEATVIVEEKIEPVEKVVDKVVDKVAELPARSKFSSAEERDASIKESQRRYRERKAAEAGRVTKPDSTVGTGDAKTYDSGGSETVTGRKANRIKSTVLSSKPNGKVTDGGAPVAVADYDSWGQNASQLLEMAGIQLFGPVGKFASKEEQGSMAAAASNYFRSMGLTDLPPGWVLLGVVSMYTISRATDESGRAHFVKLLPKKSKQGILFPDADLTPKG
jgi:hypothetical protein